MVLCSNVLLLFPDVAEYNLGVTPGLSGWARSLLADWISQRCLSLSYFGYTSAACELCRMHVGLSVGRPMGRQDMHPLPASWHAFYCAMYALVK